MKIAAWRVLNILMTGFFVVFGLPVLALSIYVAVMPINLYVKMHADRYTQMQTSRDYIRAFQEMHGRMPSDADFVYWSHADYRVKGSNIEYQAKDFSDELIHEFGPAPEGAYVLSFWTGNNRAASPSWAKNDRVGYVSEEDFWTYGSRWKDVAMHMVWWLVLLMLATISNIKLRRLIEEKKRALLRE